jgi:uncharacterized protein YkwD/Ni/Co efflux regulator RcnB
MKKVVVCILFAALWLTACTGGAQPTTAAIPTERETTAPTQIPTHTPVPTEVKVHNPPDCTDSAAFVADVTVDDYSQFKQGETLTKTWRVENTGTCTWYDAYNLVFYSGDPLGAPESQPLSVTAPGETQDISVKMTAPDRDAVVRADFELHNPEDLPMPIDTGQYLWVIISVENPETASSGSTSGSGGGSSSGTTSGSVGASGNSDGSGPGLAVNQCRYLADASKTQAVVTTINSTRAQNGLPALTVNPLLIQAAQAHIIDMACNQLFYHNGSNGSTPASRVAAVGYGASGVTENVYGSYPPLDGPGVVSWWATDQADPRHNANLLTTKYSEIGVGYAFFDNFGYYVVDFAAP